VKERYITEEYAKKVGEGETGNKRQRWKGDEKQASGRRQWPSVSHHQSATVA